jgi:hypothetical protein
MGWKNKGDLREYEKRRANRGIARSQELEQRVVGILQNMQGRGLISDYTNPAQNGFSVLRVVGEEPAIRTFSVTLSLQGRNRARAKGVTNRFCILPETKTETVEKKIVALFEA